MNTELSRLRDLLVRLGINPYDETADNEVRTAVLSAALRSSQVEAAEARAESELLRREIVQRRAIETRQGALILLGDRLRSATTLVDCVKVAAEVVGGTLAVSRAGYAIVGRSGGTFEVLEDWTSDVTSLAGSYEASSFAATVGCLKSGHAVATGDVSLDPRLERDLPAYARINTRAQINVPLLDRGILVGILFVHHSRARIWEVGEIDFAVAVADRVYAALAKVQAEREQRLLSEELGHRLKNTLAMVQSIARQTLRHVEDRDAVKALESRLFALSSAHDVLLQRSWSSAQLRPLMEGVLSLHGGLGQFELAGPDLTFGPRATLSLSMLLHELSTNAAKYGSLSCETGRVHIAWGVERSDGEPVFRLAWVESGGPKPELPTTKGFGSRLIDLGLLGTKQSVVDYAFGGLAAEFRAPLAAVCEQ